MPEHRNEIGGILRKSSQVHSVYMFRRAQLFSKLFIFLTTRAASMIMYLQEYEMHTEKSVMRMKISIF